MIGCGFGLVTMVMVPGTQFLVWRGVPLSHGWVWTDAELREEISRCVFVCYDVSGCAHYKEWMKKCQDDTETVKHHRQHQGCK